MVTTATQIQERNLSGLHNILTEFMTIEMEVNDWQRAVNAVATLEDLLNKYS